MRLLLDQNVPFKATALLSALGYDVVHATSLGMQLAPDEAYITLAIPEQRVIVTLDADFHAILATQGLTQPSVIRLRMHNPDPQEVALAIDEICKEYAGELRDGCAIFQ